MTWFRKWYLRLTGRANYNIVFADNADRVILTQARAILKRRGKLYAPDQELTDLIYTLTKCRIDGVMVVW